MMRTILVPLDGSRLAELVLPHARRLATLMNATLLLVRVAQTWSVRSDPREPQVPSIVEAEHYLRQVEQALTRDGFTVRTKVMYDDATHAILRAATTDGVDLIMMSTHGRSGVGRAVLGSVADQVLHAATAPVLLVRAAHQPGLQREGPYHKILVPLDRTALAERAVRYVATAAFAQNAEIILLHTEHPTPVTVAPGAMGYMSFVAEQVDRHADEEAERHRTEARSYLEATADAYLHGHGWQAYVAIGDPVESILQLSNDDGVELIAMATHARIGVDRLVHGSVAAGVLHRADVPVLLLPAAITTPDADPGAQA